MKSFIQFCEDVSLSDLERRHSQSPEGKRQARTFARKRAEKEAEERRASAKEFTERHRAQMLAKKAAQQPDEDDSNTETQKPHNTSKTGRNIRRAITKTAKNVIKSVRRRVQSNETP
jgi:hypothetical protein